MNAPNRRPPFLQVIVRLESQPVVTLYAETYEDEQRLRGWLRRSASLRRLSETVKRSLGDLEQAA